MARIGARRFFASILSELFLFTVLAASGTFAQQGHSKTAFLERGH